jgi:hypothetical protein
MMQIFVYQKIGLQKIQSRCCYDYILISTTIPELMKSLRVSNLAPTVHDDDDGV